MTQRGANYVKRPGDTYMTPPSAVAPLLRVERIFGPVWEPACGEGGIIIAIQQCCPHAQVIGSDIDPKDDQSGQSIDFLTGFAGMMVPEQWPWTIITNPPYGTQGRLALRFVEHALEITQICEGKVIMLLPADWDCGKTRQHVLRDFEGFVGKYSLLERIRWTNLPQAESGPAQNHAWFVWDHARKGRDMGWLGGVK